MNYRAVLNVSLVALSVVAGTPASAQDDAALTPPSDIPSAAPAGTDEGEKLAKQLANPIASLISVPLQSNFDWGSGPGGQGGQYKLNVQPVVPITLNSDWNLISRTIVPLVAQHDIIAVAPASDRNQFGLGDTLQSLFFSPQKPTRGGIIWGIGPAFLVPTATDKSLGAGKWGAGPTIVALKQSGPWTAGALANHLWSVAGQSDREKVSATFLQPFVAYTTKTATTVTVNSESTYDWVHKQWTVPVNVILAQLLPPTKTGLPFPLQLQFGVRHYFVSAPQGPENGVRFSLVALFPRS